MASELLRYTVERLRLDPVPLDHPRPASELDELAPSLIGESGNDPDLVLATFAEVLAPAVMSADSTRFLSMIPAAPTKAALLFDSVVSASSLNGISWLEAAGAVHAENQVLRWLADLAGLGDDAGGCFVSGGSAANLSALVVARDLAIRARPHVGRWSVVVADSAHSSITGTLRILGVDPVPVPTIDGRLTGDSVVSALADRGGDDVCAVVATAGTTNAGIVDDLDGVGRAATEAGIWFHVDGAYGAAALLSPTTRHRFAGIERADSLVVDPHKWLFAPFDCAALLYRSPQAARAVHTQEAAYLDAIHERPDEWNPTDYAFHLTRRARGLALWFSLCVHGVAAYRDAVQCGLDLAQWTADRVDESPELELIRRPELGVVLFRRIGWDAAAYWTWSRRLLADQVALALPSIHEGETVARLVFLHPGTTTGIVEEILDSMRVTAGIHRPVTHYLPDILSNVTFR